MTSMTYEHRRDKLHVLFATSECVPFVKTGGLADVAGALPRALKHAGIRVSVVLPKYASIPWEYLQDTQHVADFYVPLSWRFEYCGVEKLTYQGIDYYFIDNEGYFKRDGLYGHFDDGERFAFFAKAICEAIHYVPELRPHIIHCNDWQTALVPVFLHEFYHDIEGMGDIRTVMSIHNLKFQGQFGDQMIGDVLGLSSKPDAVRQLYRDDHSINFMQAGLCYVDRICTVSPTYAEEIQLPFYGEGLDGLLRRRSCILRGILNGIDIEVWNPRSDKLIPNRYSPTNLSGKARCKAHLQEELHLDQDPHAPLIAMIGRLTDQKGIALVRYAMDRIISEGAQMAVLGTGDSDHEEAFRYFEQRYAGRVSARITFDNALSHRMYAGSDMFLMPSIFEPCGLSQMIAMRYGSVCIVRETGGLRDSVSPYNQYTGEGVGFSFANINADEMGDTIVRAMHIYRNEPEVWAHIQNRAMKTRFSWNKQATEYVDVYRQLCPM